MWFEVTWDSRVSIATCYGLDGLGSNQNGARLPKNKQNGPGAHTASCMMGTWSFSQK